MPTIDEQLRDRVRSSGPATAGADDLFVRLGARKRRRATTRKLGTVGLITAVLAGTVGAFVVLGRAFDDQSKPASAPTASNGSLVVSASNEDSLFLFLATPDKLDLDSSKGSGPVGPEGLNHLVGDGADRDTYPAVSPDGSTVAFEHHDFKGAASLGLVDMDGSNERDIVPRFVDVASPTWSPDGSWIAFAATRVEGQPLGFVHPDGSGLTYPLSPAPVDHVSWSPDGSRLVFSAAASSGDGHDLWTAGFDPTLGVLTDPQQVTSSPVDESDPTWSPDGTSIDFVTPDGIEQMPAEGGPSVLIVPTNPAGVEGRPDQPAWSPDGRYLTFVLEPPEGQVGPWVYELPVGDTDPYPIAWGDSFAWQPELLGSSPSRSSSDPLGVGMATCRVQSMPITIGGSAGSAYVFTKEDTNCPKPGEGDRFVAADLTGDGVVDTPPIQLDGCFPPIGCEAFAAPDVNGDGTSEVAVSTAGADGYGVWLFALTTSPPAIVPVDVVDPQGIGNVQTGPLQFAWVDVAGHAEAASCVTSADGTDLTIFGYDKFVKETDVRTTSLHLEGTTATVTNVSTDRVSLADAPAPGNDLCGSPLLGSAANFPNATEAAGLDIGIGEPLCDVSELHADFTGDGAKDTAWVGLPARSGSCSDVGEGAAFVAMDDTGDGSVDGNYVDLPGCTACRAYAAADLDGDGIPEFIVLIQSSATPTYGIYEAITGPNMEPSSGLVPVTMTSDAPAMGLSAGDPLIVTTGGDEGYSYAVGCEGSQSSQVLVQWRSEHPIEGPGSDVRDVFVTKLRLAAGTASMVDSQHTTQPTGDPLPFDSRDSTGCAVRWFPPE